MTTVESSEALDELPTELLDVPELAPYQDEPGQAPAGGFMKTGILRMRFAQRGDRSLMTDLYRKTPLLVQQALYWDPVVRGLPCVYMISTSGCVLQGDRLYVRIDMEPGSMAHVTTQSATKVHRMDANFASMVQTLTLDEDSYLELMPGTLIPHRDTRYLARTEVTIHPTATLLYSEVVLGGRKHHAGGELFVYDLLSMGMTARRPDGEHLFTEKLLVEPKQRSVRQAGVMGEHDVFGNVFLLTPAHHAAAVLEQVPTGPSADGRVVCGASVLPHQAGLVFKVLGTETEPVHAAIREFWRLVRHEVLDQPIPDKPLWG
ncbi:urease accessory protein UreD [Rhodococcus sp. X156]|uniref:urease accessory protein UreD n=1 Tax=Rhodococcus sp. X156 TaxID=2499145 RepID=UPI001F49AFC3|nr:urease accessory protein UreD [Rhodococcus sp. X156]